MLHDWPLLRYQIEVFKSTDHIKFNLQSVAMDLKQTTKLCIFSVSRRWSKLKRGLYTMGFDFYSTVVLRVLIRSSSVNSKQTETGFNKLVCTTSSQLLYNWTWMCFWVVMVVVVVVVVCVCVYYPFAVGAFINIVLLALEGFCWGVWLAELLGVIGSANCRIILMTQTTAP